MIDPGWDLAVPDSPRWVETRSLLLHDSASVFGSPDAGLVVSHDGYIVGVVGKPGPEVLSAARPGFDPEVELLVPSGNLEHLLQVLPEGRARRAVLHRLAGPFQGAAVEGVEIAEVDDRFMAMLPAELVPEVDGAYIAAFRMVGDLVVSVCAAGSITETLWDVGIDTLEGHRRRGYARDCYLTLAAELAERRLEPVWGAYEDNEASLSMARSLGFEPVDEIWVVAP